MPTSDRLLAALAPLALVASCSSPDQPAANGGLAQAEAKQGAAAAEDGRILCAVGKGELVRDCTVEQASTDRGLVLTLRRPDGGFRRLLVTRDGRGLVAADGAVPAKVVIVGPDEIEVTLGEDRYRLPATVRK